MEDIILSIFIVYSFVLHQGSKISMSIYKYVPLMCLKCTCIILILTCRHSVILYLEGVCTAGDRTPDDPSHPATDRQLPVRIPWVYTTGPRTDVWRVWIGR